MLNIAEYRQKTDRLADHLPWAALVAPGVVLNKDGSFQRTFAFRGPDLESATEAELVGACARANNVLQRFGSGWALFFDVERHEALDYPISVFPDHVSWLVDHERQADFQAQGQHYESAYHLTLLWLPPPDGQESAARTLIDSPETQSGRDWRAALAQFLAETGRAFDLLAAFLPEISALTSVQTLTYLHSTISERRHEVLVPETPMYLDGLLADTSLVGGLKPQLGNRHLRTLTLLGFPAMSRPCILDALNAADFSYRWTTRFISLDKRDATRALTSLRRQWFNKRKSLTAMLREVMYQQPTLLTDIDAENKTADADVALQLLGADHVAFGYLTTTVSVMDTDRDRVEDKARAVERIINGLGFTVIRETVNAVEAWLSSLPGHVYANVRQPLVHTLNLAHLMPLSSVWAGPASNEHLDGPPLLVARTAGATPFRLSTQRARASPCCWRCWHSSSGAMRMRRSSSSIRDCQPGRPCWRWAVPIIVSVSGRRKARQCPSSRFVTSTRPPSELGPRNGLQPCWRTRQSWLRPRSRMPSGRRSVILRARPQTSAR
jgi:type IV secretion system protein VirB4